MLEDDQRRFDFPRGAQLAALRALRLPDGIPRSGSKVRASTLLAVLRVIDDRSGKNGEQWWDQGTIGTQAGLSSRTVSKAMQVLESMDLITKTDTRRGGARRLVVSINWQTVFSDREPCQDPTILASWGLFEPALDDGFNSELVEVNSELSSEFNSERGSELIRNGVPNSLLSKATKNPPTLHEGGRASECFDSGTGRECDDTETGTAGSVLSFASALCEGRTAAGADRAAGEPLVNAVETIAPASYPTVREAMAGKSGSLFPVPRSFRVPAGAEPADDPRTRGIAPRVNEPAARNVSTLEPSNMPTRIIDPRERELIRRLVDLGVGSAAATLREALRIGYRCETVAAVLEWFESETLVDPVTGERVRPYHVGQLVTRLRDEFATDARPECGQWGGRRGEWTALKLRLSAPKAAAGRVPDLSAARRAAVVEGLSRAAVLRVLEVLASGDGPDVPRALKCLAWINANWLPTENRLIPPANVIRFLMQFNLEAILKGVA